MREKRIDIDCELVYLYIFVLVGKCFIAFFNGLQSLVLYSSLLLFVVLDFDLLNINYKEST